MMRNRRVLLGIASGVAVSLCIAILLPFFNVFVWSAAIATIARPGYAWLLRYLGNRSVTAFVVCLGICVGIIVPTATLSIPVVKEAANWRAASQAEANRPNGSATTARQKAHTTAREFRTWLQRGADAVHLNLDETIDRVAEGAGNFAALKTLPFFRQALWALVQFVLTLIATFFLLRDGDNLRTAVGRLIPLTDPDIDTLLKRISDTLYAVVYGNCIVALAQGTLAGVAYWALGVPMPMLCTVLTVLFCLVPLVGAPIIWLPLSLFLVLQGEYSRAIMLSAWGMLVVGTIDNVLRPLIIGTRTGQHPALVFFSTLGSVLVVGPSGIVIGPILLSVTLSVLEMAARARQAS